jgi:alpha-galactosidase
VDALPPQCAALNRSYLNVVDLIVDGALAENPRAIRQALMVDPNTAASLTVEQIWDMCDALVAAHGDALPAWARNVDRLDDSEYSITANRGDGR